MSGSLSTSCAGLSSNTVEESQDVTQGDFRILMFGRLGLSLTLGWVLYL
jgi:hypothetical protein